MSGLINPHAAPEEAAYALLIELVRAQRVPQYEGEISGLLAMYDEAVKHFKERDRALGVDIVVREKCDACGSRAGVGWIAVWVISCRGR